MIIMSNKEESNNGIFTSLGNQLLSSIFTDSISILSNLRQNIADIRGSMMDYDNKMLFL